MTTNNSLEIVFDKQLLGRSYIFGIMVNIFTYGISLYFPKKENILFYDFILGIIFTYIIDILFIQKLFKNFTTQSLEVISYNNLVYRFKYLFRYRIFLKYLIVIIIGSILVSSLTEFIKKTFKKYNIFQGDFKNKVYFKFFINILLKFIVTAIFLNFIKFKWAYIDNNDIYLTAIIISLLNLSVLSSL